MEKAGFEARQADSLVCAVLLGLWSQTAMDWDSSSITDLLCDRGTVVQPL